MFRTTTTLPTTLGPAPTLTTNTMSNQPTANQRNIIQTIQPAQASQLIEALKDELAKAEAAGNDSAAARQHYLKAERIKQILVTYRQQQEQRSAARSAASAGTPNMDVYQQQQQQNQPSQQPPQQSARNPVNLAPQPQYDRQGSPQSSGLEGDSVNNAVNVQNRSGSSAAAAAAGTVTTDRYNQVRTRLQELEKKIRDLEASKRSDIDGSDTEAIDNQLNELKLKYGQFSKFALYMRNQLMEQARNGQNSGTTAPVSTAGAVGSAGTAGLPQNHTPTPAQQASVANSSNNIGGANIGNNGNNSSAGASVPAGGPMGLGDVSGSAAHSPSKGRSASPGVKETGVPGVNLAGITKPSVPSIPISSTISVKPPTPTVLKPGSNNMRPTLTGGTASGLGQVMGSPLVRMPTFDMASTGPIPDNSGRVLTKRKLTELVNTLGADEGDGKTTIDGDVEELLLDLADEFVTSVTSFACRLAKHRKTDSVDVRDIQLHLERNWNIRIPGHAMDEVRNMRKYQPSLAYNQKKTGVEIAKAVNGNMN